MKRIFQLFLALFLLVAISSVASAANYKFIIAYTDAPRLKVGDEKLIHVTVAAVYAFEDAINSLTGGAFDVDFKHSGVLGGQIETLDQVLAGSIQATTPAIPALAGYFPHMQIFSIPYLWDNPAVAWEVLDGEFGQKFFDAMAKQSKLRIITIFDNGGYRSFTNNIREIRKPADMKGIKIRVMESPTQMKIVESLGGAPTPIAWTELYSSLQTGVVDGQENSPATIVAGSLHEVQKYYTLDQHTLSLAVFAVSEDWFQSLPADIRTKVKIAGRIASVAGRGAAWTNNKLALAYVTRHGMKVYHPKPEERATFKKLAQPGVLDWMRKNPKIDNKWVDSLLAAVDEAEKKLGMK
ncbi:MAG: DctP family TRAP transporter solute-binding subunit [Proteobacteria bacterium]|nr:DctP family TRAP transporter solute-binding subunit [Pseudomonadota bacterium]